MSHSNGYISDPVDLIADIKAVLGITDDDLSEFCTYAGMNIWSQKKPVKWRGDIRYNDWWKAYNQQCGINIGYDTDLVHLIQQWLQVANYSWRGFWQYDPPVGNDEFPFNQMDFLGYQHGDSDSLQPWDQFTFPTNITRIWENNQYVFTAFGQLNKRNSDTHLLTMENIHIPYGAGTMDLASMYFGVAIVKQSGNNFEYAFLTSYYDFKTDVNQQPEPHMDGSYGLTIRDIPNLTKYNIPATGNYFVFPFLSSDRLWDNGIYTGDVSSNPVFMQARQSFSGLFVPLFHSGKAVTVVDQAVIITLVLSASKPSNSYRVDLTLIATNTDSNQRDLPESYLTYSFTVFPMDANGSIDYTAGVVYSGQWGNTTRSIGAGASITLTTSREFTNYGVIGGYIANIQVTSSYGYITRQVAAGAITYGGFATGIQIVNAGGTVVSSLSIERTYSQRVYYRLIPSDAYGDAGWSSSNESIATVSGGLITARGTGSCTIYCTYSQNPNIQASLTLNVTALRVTAIAITTSYANMLVGQTYQWAAQLTPQYPDDPVIVWSSGNTSIATVDQNGLVTPVGAGGTWITATAHDNPNISDSVNVAVAVPVVMTGIRILDAPASLAVNSSMTLRVLADYSDGTSVDVSSNVTWTYDNTIFDKTGTRTFKALKTGGGAIGAEYNGFTNSVYVSTTAQLTGVSLAPSSKTLYVGDSFTVTATATYWNGTSYTTQNVTSSVTWTTPSCLSRSGNTFTATSAGSGTITASYGGYAPTCSVTAYSEVAVQSVTILGDDVIQTGNTGALMTADYYPSNASLASTGAFAWTCDDNRVLVGNPSSQTCRVRCSTELTTTLRVTVTDSQGNTATDSMTIIFSNEPI